MVRLPVRPARRGRLAVMIVSVLSFAGLAGACSSAHKSTANHPAVNCAGRQLNTTVDQYKRTTITVSVGTTVNYPASVYGRRLAPPRLEGAGILEPCQRAHNYAFLAVKSGQAQLSGTYAKDSDDAMIIYTVTAEVTG